MSNQAYADFARLRPGDALRKLEARTSGLTADEANSRLAVYGPNELTEKRVSALSVLSRQFKGPLVWMLAVAAGIALFLGERLDAATIVVTLLINTAIGFWQEYRSEHAIAKLSAHLAARARVRRDGEIKTVPRRELVPGDIVVLNPGDIAPADLRLVVAHNLVADESVLTGESMPVEKTVAALDGATRPDQARNCVFMLSQIRTGFAEGLVIATRFDTELGHAAKLTEETKHVSAFEKNISQLASFLMKAVLLVLAVVFVANLLIKGRDHAGEQLLFAIALAVSVIPEALPAVASITLARGALKLATKSVVVRRLSAIEDLGHIEILCTDKTGTITQSIMHVAGIFGADPRLTHLYALGCAAEEEIAAFRHPKTFDAALAASADRDLMREHEKMGRFWHAPFDPARRRSSAVVTYGGKRLMIALGAPEEIAAHCAGDASAMIEAAKESGRQGHRTLAVAVREVPERTTYGGDDERGMSLAGWIAFADPLKPTAKKAIHDARMLSVDVRIITGDGVEVAEAIAREVGILTAGERALSGPELDKLDDGAFEQAVAAHKVFARIVPEQKYRIIQALQHGGRQVGFMGEGINDAPALKLADVSLVVDSASDVSREAADIILLKKDLHVVVDGIREGRMIFTNIVKYVKYTLIGNLGNFLSIAGISVISDFLPMLPVQILLTNLLTDFPLIAVASDGVAPEELMMPKHFNIRELAFIGVFLGAVSSLFDFIVFGLYRHQPVSNIQTAWFVFSVLTELALIWSIRARGPFWKAPRPGVWLAVLTLAAAVAAAVLPFTYLGATVLHLVKPVGNGRFLVFGLVAAYFLMTEAVKLAYGKIFPQTASHAVKN